MKLTLKQLVESLSAQPGKMPALHAFAKDDRLPIRTSYWASKILRQALKEMQEYEVARVKLCEASGATADTATNQFHFNPEQLKVFMTGYNELVAVEIELPGEPFTLEKLGDVRLSAAAMMSLEWLIVE